VEDKAILRMDGLALCFSW